MQEDQRLLKTQDGLQLFCRVWVPDDQKIKGLICLLHGYAEHAGRYLHVAQFFVEEGFAVAAIDHRGHGRSQGKRAYVKSLDQYVNDIQFWIDDLKENYEGLPHFLLAHSMGALLAILYCVRKKPSFQGVVLPAAAVKISRDFSPVLQKLAPLIGKILPYLPTTKIDPAWLATDSSVGADFLKDPLNYSGGILAGFGWATLKATREVGQLFVQFDLPMFVLHGADDKLSDPQGSRELHHQAVSNDKSLKIYEELRHEIFNELEKEKVLGDVRDWIEARLPNQPSSF